MKDLDRLPLTLDCCDSGDLLLALENAYWKRRLRVCAGCVAGKE